MGCATSAILNAPGGYPFLVQNRHECSKVYSIFKQNFTDKKSKDALQLNHKGEEDTDTPYKREKPEIVRVFLIKQCEQKINQKIDKLHLKQISTADDGNCLFRSISRQLYGMEDKHLEIRSKIVAYLEKNVESFVEYFDSMEHIKKYVDKMSKPGTWGDELMLHCAAEKFQIEVHVLNYDENEKLSYKHYTPGFAQDTRDVSHRHVFLSYIALFHFQTICSDKTFKKSRSVVDVQ